MARVKKDETMLTLEEKLGQALVPDWEWPYQIPQNWRWAKLKSVSAHISDGSHNPPKDSGKGIPLLSATNIRDHSIDISGAQRWITEEEWHTENMRTRIEPNDVLLTIVATLGRTAVVKNERFALQRSVAVIKPRINSEYLSYYFESPYVQAYITDHAKGTAQKGFYLRSLEDLYCCIPPITEQQRIVDCIESLFAKLDEAKEKAQATLDSFETRKAAILHKAFSGVLTAKWRAEHGMDLASWTTDEIINRFDVAGGVQKSPMRTPKNNPIPYLTVANVFRDRLDLTEIRYFEVFEGELNKLKLEKKDILVVEGNGSGNEIGRCAMWNNELPVCIHQNHIIRLRSKDQNTIPEYVLYYLNSDTGKRIMRERAKTTAGLFNLSTGKIKTIPIPFASCNEQKEIVALLDKILAKEAEAKEAAEMVLDQIDQMKKAILSRAFRGELGTNDPTEESALELLKSILVDKKQEIEDKPSKKRLVIPNEVAALLSSNLEKELIKIFYKEDRDLVPMSRLMAVSSMKFEVIGAIKKLQQKGIIQKTDNGDFKLVR